MLRFAYDVRFESLGAYLDAVEATRASAGNEYRALGDVAYSLDDADEFHGQPLKDMVAACRTMQGFAEDIASIARLADTLQGMLRPVHSIKRQRTTGRHGYAVRPHAVLRGDLAHMWKRTVRSTHAGITIIMGVLLPIAYYDAASPDQIRVTMAANATLIAALEQSGRRCEVWAIAANATAFQPHGGHRQCICLKHAGDRWNMQALVCIADRAFYRRLGFRMLEAQQDRLPLSGTYGGRGRDFWPVCLTQTAETLGYALETCLHGASPATGLSTLEGAQQWLTTTLQRFLEH